MDNSNVTSSGFNDIKIQTGTLPLRITISAIIKDPFSDLLGNGTAHDWRGVLLYVAGDSASEKPLKELQ
jgi:hypothetical protein